MKRINCAITVNNVGTQRDGQGRLETQGDTQRRVEQQLAKKSSPKPKKQHKENWKDLLQNAFLIYLSRSNFECLILSNNVPTYKGFKLCFKKATQNKLERILSNMNQELS